MWNTRPMRDGGAMTDRDVLRAQATDVLAHARHCRSDGIAFRVPNERVYPHQWLWDSCFHAVALVALGQLEDACEEIEALFSAQTPHGFVPHMTYHLDPAAALVLWRQAGRSNITQPPMYGHALRVLHAAVHDRADRELIERVTALEVSATKGLNWLFENRANESGRLVSVHPWESGCDNSPRMDGHLDGPWSRPAWDDRKRAMLDSLCDAPGGDEGAPVDNPAFRVESAQFNALVAFNAQELAAVTGDRDLLARGDALAAAVDDLWDDELGTWCDRADGLEGPLRDAVARSGRVRTASALTQVLVTQHPDRPARVFAQLVDPAAFGAPYGPTEVHRGEPTYDPRGYWRGATWPQISYLLWLAADRAQNEHAALLASQLQAAVVQSGYAEYWHPDSGEGLGAVPCTWATIAVAT